MSPPKRNGPHMEGRADALGTAAKQNQCRERSAAPIDGSIGRSPELAREWEGAS